MSTNLFWLDKGIFFKILGGIGNGKITWKVKIRVGKVYISWCNSVIFSVILIQLWWLDG